VFERSTALVASSCRASLSESARIAVSQTGGPAASLAA